MIRSAFDLLRYQNGFRSKPYDGTTRQPIRRPGSILIGYGRDLQSIGISEAEAGALLWREFQAITAQLCKWPEWAPLNAVRRAVLIDMAHALGVQKVGLKTNFRKALVAKKWDVAAEQVKRKHTGRRASRWQSLLVSGTWP